MVAFPDMQGVLDVDGNLRVISNNDPAVYPGDHDELGGFGNYSIAYVARKTLYDPTTRLLSLVDNERILETRAPDVSIVIHPGERIYGRGLDNTNEQIVGALLAIDPLDVPDTNDFSNASFDDVVFNIADTLGTFASGTLTDIRVEPDAGLVAHLVLDPALPGDRPSRFIDRLRLFLPRIRLCSIGAWNMLVSGTESFTQVQEHPLTDLMIINWDRNPDARIVCTAEPDYLYENSRVVIRADIENTTTGILTLVQFDAPVTEGMRVDPAGINPASSVIDDVLTCTFNAAIPPQTALSFNIPLLALPGTMGLLSFEPTNVDLGPDVEKEVIPAVFTIGDNDFDGIPDYIDTDWDGDLADNSAEEVMGTNPFDRLSVLKVVRMADLAGIQRIFFDTVAARHYFLSEATDPAAGWTRRPGPPLLGDSGEASFGLDGVPPHSTVRIEVEYPD
jgi:hypothetical protein